VSSHQKVIATLRELRKALQESRAGVWPDARVESAFRGFRLAHEEFEVETRRPGPLHAAHDYPAEPPKKNEEVVPLLFPRVFTSLGRVVRGACA